MKTTHLRTEINDLERALAAKRGELANTERVCRHDWGPTEPDHIYHEAYTIPGDEPGTCGVDWRGPCYVPAKTDYRWKRVCRTCGKVEHTTATDEHVTRTPRF